MKKVSVKLVSNVAVITFETPKILSDQDISEVAKELNEVALDVNKAVLNFQNVQFLSSAMIGKIIVFRKQIGKGGVILCCLNNTLKDIFTVTRLDKLMQICDTEIDALEQFAKE